MFKIDKFRLVVVALLAVLTVAVAACESEPEKVPDPLIVGHLNALTGSLSYFGESHSNSIGLAADHINRAGGIQGGSVILVHRDTAVNPVQGVSAAEELVNVQGVVAIVGALASGVTIPVATSVTVPNGVLQVSGASTAPAITVLEDNDFLFRTSLSDASQGVVLADLAKELGYESAGILYINNAYGEGLAAQFTESFTALGGTVIASVPHEDSQPTFVSELEKATEGDPDVPDRYQLPAGRGLPTRGPGRRLCGYLLVRGRHQDPRIFRSHRLGPSGRQLWHRAGLRGQPVNPGVH